MRASDSCCSARALSIAIVASFVGPAYAEPREPAGGAVEGASAQQLLPSVAASQPTQTCDAEGGTQKRQRKSLLQATRSVVSDVWQSPKADSTTTQVLGTRDDTVANVDGSVATGGGDAASGGGVVASDASSAKAVAAATSFPANQSKASDSRLASPPVPLPSQVSRIHNNSPTVDIEDDFQLVLATLRGDTLFSQPLPWGAPSKSSAEGIVAISEGTAVPAPSVPAENKTDVATGADVLATGEGNASAHNLDQPAAQKQAALVSFETAAQRLTSVRRFWASRSSAQLSVSLLLLLMCLGALISLFVVVVMPQSPLDLSEVPHPNAVRHAVQRSKEDRIALLPQTQQERFYERVSIPAPVVSNGIFKEARLSDALKLNSSLSVGPASFTSPTSPIPLMTAPEKTSLPVVPQRTEFSVATSTAQALANLGPLSKSMPVVQASAPVQMLSRQMCPGLIVPMGTECEMAIPSRPPGLAPGKTTCYTIRELSGQVALEVNVTPPHGSAQATAEEGKPMVELRTGNGKMLIAYCKAGPNATGRRSAFIYDAHDELFAHITKVMGGSAQDEETSARPCYVLSSRILGFQWVLEGNFIEHAVEIMNESRRIVADTEPQNMHFDTTNEYCKLRVTENTDVGLILCALLSADQIEVHDQSS
eukprot:TRINITY_DN44092_c0_g1_i1.p1 TRINITY_DN44092_c0_g1~~TRINITY_DN44092_c0_g1_i1.p1  ORF type:complete len:652 (+),score=128.08 TRINITY_DN44092_c0_g1_i1:375-2330(+)